jgi:Putative peptidoglycan binding domain
MAEFSVRRVFAGRRAVVMAAVAVIWGLAAGGAAVALAGGGRAAGGPSPGGAGSVPTAAVVRTNLTSSVQEGGSIGYAGSYTVGFPSGTSPSQLTAQQQTVTQDRQALSADQQTEADQSRADLQTVTADEAAAGRARSALDAAEAAKKKACAGAGASSPACRQDGRQASQDQAALTQARQQVAAARSTARLDHDQDAAKVTADRTALAGARSTLASLRETAVDPGTTYTWLPSAGQVIRQDQRVYAVSGVPVLLLYGRVAAYRAFYQGMSRGADVGELTRNLIGLGFGAGLTPGDSYTSATAAAVQDWQRARGLPATGKILLGEVVFEPGPIRVASVAVADGAPAGGGASGGAAGGSGGGGAGTVLTATGTRPVVTVDLDVSQDYLVRPGDAVSVVLPDGTSTVGGRVASVGSVATCPGGSGTGTGAGAGSSGGSGGSSPCSSAGSDGGAGSNSSATVPVTITLDRVPRGESLDQAPVNVNITQQRARDVLAVPVSALVALSGGGYGVDVVTGRGTVRLTGVSTGLYTSSLVQVSGPGIAAGMRVEVP